MARQTMRALPLPSMTSSKPAVPSSRRVCFFVDGRGSALSKMVGTVGIGLVLWRRRQPGQRSEGASCWCKQRIGRGGSLA